MTGALAGWLTLYLALFAVLGFVLLVARNASGREWSNRSLLRLSSGAAFVGSLVVWLLIGSVA